MICAPSETKAGGLKIQGQPGLHSEAQGSLGNLDFVQKKKKKRAGLIVQAWLECVRP